jgi:hypothetical protein
MYEQLLFGFACVAIVILLRNTPDSYKNLAVSVGYALALLV